MAGGQQNKYATTRSIQIGLRLSDDGEGVRKSASRSLDKTEGATAALCASKACDC